MHSCPMNVGEESLRDKPVRTSVWEARAQQLCSVAYRAIIVAQSVGLVCCVVLQVV